MITHCTTDMMSQQDWYGKDWQLHFSNQWGKFGREDYHTG